MTAHTETVQGALFGDPAVIETTDHGPVATQDRGRSPGSSPWPRIRACSSLSAPAWSCGRTRPVRAAPMDWPGMTGTP
ncbi:hypothetical protein [Pseudonocardia sp. ICBG601]|uniref:hypothetical protein n=1 Tax=Pseudonocardia sp. ICBG601 TaxID=2846759 RepID=UPI001CF64BF0|nr:hypothetical protein [Pseudonocardia sp. ICBG601]